MKRSIALLFFVISSLCLGSTTDDIREKYSTIRTFKCQFRQTLFLAHLNSKKEFTGDFYYKKGKGFIWIYKTPWLRYFLFDGNNLYQYDERKPYVVKERMDSINSRTYFLDLIEDIGNLERHFSVKERTFEGNSEVIRLEPKKEGMIAYVKIWFGKGLDLQKIEIAEKNGNKNLLLFKSVVLNGEIEDSKFMFRNDRGKEVIER